MTVVVVVVIILVVMVIILILIVIVMMVVVIILGIIPSEAAAPLAFLRPAGGSHFGGRFLAVVPHFCSAAWSERARRIGPGAKKTA